MFQNAIAMCRRPYSRRRLIKLPPLSILNTKVHGLPCVVDVVYILGDNGSKNKGSFFDAFETFIPLVVVNGESVTIALMLATQASCSKTLKDTLMMGHT